MAERQAETWRPPLIVLPRNCWQRFLRTVRRFFDLQMGSIWNDLAQELVDVSGVVLDVGCGGQPYRSLLPARAVYVGLDTIHAGMDFGYGAVDTVHYSGETWPIQSDAADWILVTETLEHVFTPEAFLAEAHRCLRSEGRLLLTVPFSARWHFIPYDYWRFTPSCLRRLLEEAGFEQVVVYARGNALTVACYKIMALILPLLFPQLRSPLRALVWMLMGLVASPLFLFCAIMGNFSLSRPGGDDCLGYTVTARIRSVGEGAQ